MKSVPERPSDPDVSGLDRAYDRLRMLVEEARERKRVAEAQEAGASDTAEAES